jgi:EKC/KEOPS complex subunit PCC1/LAGE3
MSLITPAGAAEDRPQEEMTVLRTEYKATTNRMLRVAVNGFMESLGVVLEVMEELDVDVLGDLERDYD